MAKDVGEISAMGLAGRPLFPLRGVVEGFYGTYYTFPERNDLIRFAGKHGFNFYLYGPKSDRQHRARWRDPYPEWVLNEFGETIRIARHAGVTFCYSISFGTPIDYASAGDLRIVQDKLQGFFERGCRAFGLLLDDMPTYFELEDNRRTFRSGAHAHSDFANRLLRWLRSLDESCRLYLCQTDYFGRAPFSRYITELGRELDPDIALFYTGPAICSPTISLEDTIAFRTAAARAPIIWDNYPANDLQMRPELHIGPLEGRDAKLWQTSSGYVANLMSQPEASKIALMTAAEYLRDPEHYEPQASWKRALLRIGGEDSVEPLHRFAENSLGSCLQPEEAPVMDRLASAVLNSLHQGESVAASAVAAELSGYLTVLDESLYYLRNRMSNLALRRDIVPWIEALDDKLWLGRFALAALQALEAGQEVGGLLRRLGEQTAAVRSNPKRIGGMQIVRLGEYALEHVHQSTQRRNQPKHPQSVVRQSPEIPAFDGMPGLDAPGYIAEGA